MKKVMVKAITAAVTVAMAVGLAGCNVATGGKKGGTRDSLKIDSKKYAGKTLEIWQWWDEGEGGQEIMKQFKEKAGVEIKWVNVPWDQYQQKLVTGVTAGTGPDLIWFETFAKPSWFIKGIALPIGDYIDHNKPAFQKYHKAVREFYTFKGKTWGYSDEFANSNMLFYNKEMFENNGLEDPLKLYKEKKWTWDKFFELGQALTQDTNGDGKIDVYAYDAWPTEQWIFTNGADFVTYDDQGNAKFALDDPKAIKGMQALRDLEQKYKIKSPWNPDKDPQQKFMSGETAMNYWGWWDLGKFRDHFGDKLGFVPFPVGPDFKGDSRDLVGNAVHGFAKTCKDPELAALYMEFARLPESKEKQKQQEQEQLERDLKNFGSQEMIDLAKKMANNGTFSPMGGLGKFGDLWGQMTWGAGDKSPAQAVAEHKQAAQAEIDNAMSGK
jgi:multiple sugar transport system substrate-binding protein